jgi:hypothetical protein
MPNRTLDYSPRLDPRNKMYRVATPSPGLHLQSRFWIPGQLLDQGQEGACVPHGVVGEAVASPVRVKLPDSQAVAWEGYDWCRRHDEFEGDFTEGTSVRAGMNWGRSKGWWDGYDWAFNMGELRSALEEGPVVVGVEWRKSMYVAKGGMVNVRGQHAGWHCLVITGYTPHHRGLRGPAYRWRNSWWLEYGVRGSAYIAAIDLDDVLFLAGGEAAVAVDRRLGL